MKELWAFFLKMQAVHPVFFWMQFVLLGLVLVSVVLTMIYMDTHHVLQRRIAKLTSDMAAQEKLRNEQYEKLIEEEGAQEKVSRLRRLTQALEASGIKKSMPEMSAELFVFTVSCICLIGGLGTALIFNSSVIGMAVAGVILVAVYAYVSAMISHNEKNTEKDVLKFINLLENMSHSEQSVGEMLNRCVPYLNEPLKSSVERCYYEIKTTGDVEKALTNLTNRTTYKQLKDVFNYLRICSMYDQNYSDIIQENRELIRMHLAFQKEKASIKKNAFADMAIIGFAGILILVIVGQMVDDMQSLLFGNMIGQGILAAIFITLGYGIYTVIKNDRK